MDSKPTTDAKSLVDEFAQAEYDSADALPFKFDSSDGDVTDKVAIADVPSVVNQESKGKSIDTLKKTLKSRRKPVINSKSPSQDVEIDANGSPRGSTTHGDNLTPTNAGRKRKLSTRGQEFRKFQQAERRGLFDDDESLQDGEETAPRLNDVLKQFGAGDVTYTEPRRYTPSYDEEWPNKFAPAFGWHRLACDETLDTTFPRNKGAKIFRTEINRPKFLDKQDESVARRTRRNHFESVRTAVKGIRWKCFDSLSGAKDAGKRKRQRSQAKGK